MSDGTRSRDRLDHNRKAQDLRVRWGGVEPHPFPPGSSVRSDWGHRSVPGREGAWTGQLNQATMTRLRPRSNVAIPLDPDEPAEQAPPLPACLVHRTPGKYLRPREADAG